MRLIRDLERAGRLDRALEFLPDDETLAARAAHGHGLVRPELAVLLAYAKMSLDDDLLRLRPARRCPNSPAICAAISRPALRDRFAAQIAAHPLRREITATVVTNDLVNRAGLTFVHDMRARTGRAAPEIARAYRIVRDVFELPDLVGRRSRRSTTRCPAQVQTEMLLDIAGLDRTRGRLAAVRADASISAGEIAALRAARAAPRRIVCPSCCLTRDRGVVDERTPRLGRSRGAEAAGHPHRRMRLFSPRHSRSPTWPSAPDRPLDRAARIYYGVGARFALDEMRAAARRLPAETPWQKQAVEAMIDDFFALQADLARAHPRQRICAAEPDPLAAWSAANTAALSPQIR